MMAGRIGCHDATEYQPQNTGKKPESRLGLLRKEGDAAVIQGLLPPIEAQEYPRQSSSALLLALCICGKLEAFTDASKVPARPATNGQKHELHDNKNIVDKHLETDLPRVVFWMVQYIIILFLCHNNNYTARRAHKKQGDRDPPSYSFTMLQAAVSSMSRMMHTTAANGVKERRNRTRNEHVVFLDTKKKNSKRTTHEST